jgi:hypothetical protein
MAESNEEPLPDFQHLLRQLYKKTHPDLLRAVHPEAAVVNDSSMQVLNGILSTIKQYNEFPPQIVKRVPFFVRDPEGQMKSVELNIRTAGGDSRKTLTASFTTFFAEVGFVPPDKARGGSAFLWGKEYFPIAPPDTSDEAGMI